MANKIYQDVTNANVIVIEKDGADTEERYYKSEFRYAVNNSNAPEIITVFMLKNQSNTFPKPETIFSAPFNNIQDAVGSSIGGTITDAKMYLSNLMA